MKKMSKLLIALLFCANVLFAQNASEDALIMRALYYSTKSPKKAAKEWKKLFESTSNEAYLKEYFYAELRFKDIRDVVRELRAELAKKKSKDLYGLLVNLYVTEGDKGGLEELVRVLPDKDLRSMLGLAYIYIKEGKFDKAYILYSEIYDRKKSWESLRQMVAILAQEGKMSEAKELLFKQLQSNNKLPKEAYMLYLSLSNEKKEPQKVLFILKKLYALTKDKNDLKQLIRLYLYTRDYKELIPLLEKTHFDNALLYQIYMENNQPVKAYKLLFTLKKSKDPRWFAQEAIATFEVANKYKSVDKDLLKRVSELFDKAIKLGVKNASYDNYYGYTLIDYDIDIPKGMKLVKEALKMEPNNIYYLDSLGWGYVKLHKCKEAKRIFKKIQKLTPTQKLEADIVKHIKSAKSCKEQ